MKILVLLSERFGVYASKRQKKKALTSQGFEDKKNQIEAQRSGFDLERRRKGAQTKNPATLKGLPDFERSGLCSDLAYPANFDDRKKIAPQIILCLISIS